MNKKKRSKRYLQSQEIICDKVYSISEAIALLKKLRETKFEERVEFACSLDVDLKRSDKAVRGSVLFPHSTGKKVKVLVLIREEEGEEVEKIKETGADFVGFEDYIEKIKAGWLGFDVILTKPSYMKELVKLGKILGPRGLMPSPKTGTVTDDLKKAIEEVKKGRAEFKMDKGGNIHLPIGNISQSNEFLQENIEEVIKNILQLKSDGAKTDFIRSAYISSTMSPSIKIKV